MENKKQINWKLEIGQRLIDYNKDGSTKRDLIIIDRKYENSFKYYKYLCNMCLFNCGYHYSSRRKEYKDELWTTETHLEQRHDGCSCCNGTVIIDSINSIYKTDTWMIPYIGEECAKTHTYNSNDKVEVICPDCGKVKHNKMLICNIYKRKSIACTCSDKISYPNKFAYELLNQLDKIYKFDYLEHEYSPNWIKPRRYDNYFIYKGVKYILEMDGGLGHGKGNYKNNMTAEESKYIDDYKDKLAIDNGIEVIRIDCELSHLEFIKQNILKSKLNELFNLNNDIDWLKCGLYAISNLMKEACEYKKNNPELSTVDIGKTMGFSRNTIKNWLKKGYLLDLCEYNSEVEKIKGRKKNNGSSKKQLIILKNDICLKIFPSAIDLEQLSLNEFGIKLSANNIRQVCLREKKSHQGFQFKYIEDLIQEEYVKYNIENKLKEYFNKL